MINSPYIVDGADLCRCGKRRGLHRYGDEACPNRLWKCGNGQPQWLTVYYCPADMNATRIRANNTKHEHAAI